MNEKFKEKIFEKIQDEIFEHQGDKRFHKKLLTKAGLEPTISLRQVQYAKQTASDLRLMSTKNLAIKLENMAWCILCEVQDADAIANADANANAGPDRPLHCRFSGIL